MQVGTATSKNVIDKRQVASHAVAWMIGIIVGLFGVHVTPSGEPDGDLVQLVSTALDRGQTYWSASVTNWHDAKVVLFTTLETTSCGPASQRSGPFYCPNDEHIYIDLAFLRAVHGDLARAYVIAHELGHHVQKLRHELVGPSVDIELSADCYAGEWMRQEQILGHLIGGDTDGAIAEAEAVGDDRLSPGSSPETWTHGSGAQRAESVRRGIAGGCP